MWRILLVVTAVAGIGLAAVEAGGVQTSAEEIQSFSTSTSLTVPCTPTPLTQLWVRGPSTAVMGSLDTAVPAVFDSSSVFPVDNQVSEIGIQADPQAYVSWATPVAPMCGYRLSGAVTLEIDADGRRSDRLTAGLFSCPAGAPPETTVPTCRLIVTDQADRVDEGDPEDADGFLVRTVHFLERVETIVPEGEELRLKVINKRPGPLQAGGSTRDWNLKWGYRADRQSVLVFTP
jgi:hypothetical protein